MTTIAEAASAVTDAMLRKAIEAASGAGGRQVEEIERSRSPYATSSLLENVTVGLSDGSSLDLMLKHLGPRTRNEQVTRIKPAHLLDSEREILIYRDVLAPRGLGATLYGTSSPGASWPWLLVAKSAGVEMYQLGDLDAWRAAARWIGQLHAALPASEARQLPAAGRLVIYERDFCLQWMQRSLSFFKNEAAAYRAALRWLAERFEGVVDRLLASPAALLHNEYYASNVLAAPTADGWAVCPVDWEMSAIGPAVIDIAALASGDWGAKERDFILGGYREGAGAFKDLKELLDYAQLYLAVQWLGWFGRRRAPAEHSRDWLADAVERAERLRL
jgi:aminoglycoside phosphotransferase (APT) family kinase protein